MNQDQDSLSLNLVIKNAKTMMEKQTVQVNLENQLLQFKQNVEKYKSQGENSNISQNQKELNKIGMEFNPLIQTEQQLVTQIMRCHCYLPQVFLSQQQMQEFSAALDDSYIYDRRNIGTLIGMSLMGVIGFVALGFTIFGLLAGGVLGILLGRYAGRRLRKQYKLSGQLSELDVYEIRVRCYLKWAQNKGLKYRFNVNMLRFIVEKLMFEIKPALHYKQFKSSQTKQVKKLLKKVINILKEPHFFNALILSLRLSEQYLRILKLLSDNVQEASKLELEDIHIFQDFRGELEVCLLKAVDNVLKPMVGIFEETKIKNKNVIVLIHSTKYFLLQAEIIQLGQQYPDPQMSLNFIRMMAEKVKQSVRPLNVGTYMKYQNFKDIEQIGIKLEEGQKQYDFQSVRKQIQVKDVILELPDEQENEQDNQFCDAEQKNFVIHQFEKQISEIILVQDEYKEQDQNQNQEQKKDCIEIFSDSSDNNNQFSEPQLMNTNTNTNNNNNNNNQNVSTSFKFAIKQHPNKAFINKLISRPGDSDILGITTPQRSLSKHDILQILEPEQTINQNQLQKLEKSLKLDQVQMTFSLETMQKFQLFLDYYNEPIDTWEEVIKKEEIFIYKAMKPGIGSVFIKGYAFIRNADKELVFNAVYIKPFRVKWDKIMQGFDIIKSESESIDVMYYYVSPPIPIVSTREWVQRRILRRDFPQKGQICLMFYSIDLPEKPQQKGRVRAHTEIAGISLFDFLGYIFEDIEGGSKISFISNNDIRGSIPKVLVNHASAKGPFGWFGNLRKACIQYKNLNGDLSKLNIK